MKKFFMNIFSLFFILISIFLLTNKNYIYSKFHKEDSKIYTIYSNVVEVFKPAKNSVYLIAWWDIMLSRNIWYLAKNEWYDRIFKTWNYNPITTFQDCEWKDCLLIFNLESLFNENDNDIQKWWFNFRANPQNIQTLLQLRQNHTMMLSLANNHTINTTYSWVVQTKEILDSNDILRAGVWISTWESRKFAIYEKNGVKICFWAYSYDGQFVKVGAWKMSRNKTNEKIMKEDLVLMSETGCDVKILSLHRWSEYRISPNNQQKKLAHNLVDSWADLILGWHSHVPWEYEIYSGKYIFYSFWNFIFDQWWWKWSDLSYDRIFDYSLNKRTIPTYIWILAWLKIEKNGEEIEISLDKIAMSSMTNWILEPLDDMTYQWILERIKK
jgi:hypothetical protein